MTVRATEVFSGHESFACRYGWLPKLYEAVKVAPALFADDEQAIVTLGIGKNMVRSIRFWGDAFGLTQATDGRRVTLTPFAHQLFDEKRGRDPYLADVGSLWRLHWTISTTANIAAWNIAIGDVQEPEIPKQRLHDLIFQRATTARGSVTATTVAQHLEIFLRTYNASNLQLSSVIEDTLSCPLQELGFLSLDDVGTVTVQFHRGPKPSLDVCAFAHALAEFWQRVAPTSRTLSFRSIMFDRLSPGAVFRLDEGSVHVLTTALCERTKVFDAREDGAGGRDLVIRTGNAVATLQEFAWQQ